MTDSDEPRRPSPQPSPRPTPSSRARRIGGRPVPGPSPRPRPSAGTPEDTADAPPTPARTTTDDRPSPSKAPAGAPRKDRDRPSAASGRGVPLRWLPAGVFALAAITLAVLVVIASHGVYWAKTDDSSGARSARQEQALAAAKKCFAQINTYDYRKIDGLLTRDLACTTGTFTADLRRTMQTTILPNMPKIKAVQTAQVNAAGIASVSPDGTQVVTLLYGQLNVLNTNTGTTPRIDVVGAVVTVDKVRGTWLISKVDTDVGNGLGS